MDESKNVPLMISLPKKYRDLLRRMAAKKNLTIPDDVVTAARLGKEIICQYLDELANKGMKEDQKNE
jgi:predicted transcriptional regulator